MRLRVSILLGMGLAFCASANAKTMLSDFLSDQLDRAQQSACESEDEDAGAFEFNRFFLNLSAPISVGIEGVTDLSIAPEIEFVWEKAE